MVTVKMPKKCNECKFVGNYTNGLYIRNPHYCCELMWILYEEDYKVNPDIVDKYCPLKDSIIAVVEEE